MGLFDGLRNFFATPQGQDFGIGLSQSFSNARPGANFYGDLSSGLSNSLAAMIARKRAEEEKAYLRAREAESDRLAREMHDARLQDMLTGRDLQRETNERLIGQFEQGQRQWEMGHELALDRAEASRSHQEQSLALQERLSQQRRADAQASRDLQAEIAGLRQRESENNALEKAVGGLSSAYQDILGMPRSARSQEDADRIQDVRDARVQELLEAVSTLQPQYGAPVLPANQLSSLANLPSVSVAQANDLMTFPEVEAERGVLSPEASLALEKRLMKASGLSPDNGGMEAIEWLRTNIPRATSEEHLERAFLEFLASLSGPGVDEETARGLVAMLGRMG